MIKKLCFLLLLLFLFDFFGCNSKTTDKYADSKNDSIKKYLELANNDTLSFVLRNKFTDKAFSFLDLKRNDSISILNLTRIADSYYNIQNDKKFYIIFKIIHEKAVENKDYLEVAKSYTAFGTYMYNMGQNDSSLYYYLKAEKKLKKIKNKFFLGVNYKNKAFVQYELSDFIGCEYSSIKSLVLLKDTLNYNWKYASYNLIAISSNELKNYKSAISYHTKALEVIKLNKIISNKIKRGATLNNLGVVYQNIGNYKKSISYFKLALDENIKNHAPPKTIAMNIDNLAYSKFKIKDYRYLPNLFFKSILIKEKNKLYNETALSYIHLSEYYLILRDSLRAKIFAKKAKKISTKFKNSEITLVSLKLLLKSDKFNNKYIDEYVEINDSLQLAERQFRDKYARIAYETDEITQEKDKAIQQKWITSGISMTILLVIILLYIINHQRLKQKELEFQQSNQQKNGEIYELMLSQKGKEEEARISEKKRIALELHDGVMNKLVSTRLNLSILSQKTDEATIQNA